MRGLATFLVNVKDVRANNAITHPKNSVLFLVGIGDPSPRRRLGLGHKPSEVQNFSSHLPISQIN
jgi:hypothetical protein